MIKRKKTPYWRDHRKKIEPKPPRVIKKPIREQPLTSEETLKKTRKEINKLNRDRSKAHERKVAQLLSGSRIPMSGAARQYKGDVEILFSNHPGKYIIECKLSAAMNNHGKYVKMEFDWLPKLEREAKAMRAAFGVFVLHYFSSDFLTDAVWIREEDVRKIMQLTTEHYSNMLAKLLHATQLVDIRLKKINTDPRMRYNFTEHDATTYMTDIDGIKSMRYQTPHGIYLVIQLKDFREIMRDV